MYYFLNPKSHEITPHETQKRNQWVCHNTFSRSTSSSTLDHHMRFYLPYLILSSG